MCAGNRGESEGGGGSELPYHRGVLQANRGASSRLERRWADERGIRVTVDPGRRIVTRLSWAVAPLQCVAWPPRRQSGSRASVSRQCSVPGEYLRIFAPIVLGELLGDVDRAMLSSRAADGDGEIAAAGLRELGDARCEEGDQRADHRADAGVRAEEIDHGRVGTRQVTQMRLPERIRQAAHVEHEVGVA